MSAESSNGRDPKTGRFLPNNRIGRGSQPGDQRNVQYPWRVYFNRRRLPAKYRWVNRVGDAYSEGLIADKGGHGAVTEGERREIEIASAARVGWMLAWIDDDKKAVAQFMQVEQRSLLAIGLGRRVKDITPDLDAWRDEMRNGESR